MLTEERKYLLNKGLKRCNKCREIKSLDDFQRNRNEKPDGHDYSCKECRREPGEKYKEKLFLSGLKQCPKCLKVKPLEGFSFSRKSRDKKQSYCKACMNENGKKYFKTERGKQVLKAAQDKQKKINPERWLAYWTIKHAVKIGKLPNPKNLKCAWCKNNQAKEYHHHNGYSKEHRLDVVPLCITCHAVTRRK